MSWGKSFHYAAGFIAELDKKRLQVREGEDQSATTADTAELCARR